jgi:hypothetical protein
MNSTNRIENRKYKSENGKIENERKPYLDLTSRRSPAAA